MIHFNIESEEQLFPDKIFSKLVYATTNCGKDAYPANFQDP